MTRVKRSVGAKKKRREVLSSIKDYHGQRSCLYRKAKGQMLHSRTHGFHDRRHRKGQFCRLWIRRINTATHASDIIYSRFVQGLNLTGIKVDRKNLTELAINNPQALTALVKATKDALPEDIDAPAVK